MLSNTGRSEVMPQKAIFKRSPLLPCCQVPARNGQVRVDDPDIFRLYNNCKAYIDRPVLWEGLFQLACLLKDDPMEEPVAHMILDAAARQTDGQFHGTLTEQLHIARAVFAVFEYNTDSGLLQLLSSWCRAMEINWDSLIRDDNVIPQPADLMEFLVRFYRTTGIKAVLRLCTKLRAAAVDWTTILQQFHQKLPVIKQYTLDELSRFKIESKNDPNSFGSKLYLSVMPEYLADGMRYSLNAGIFSGNGQDLTAAETAWKVIRKYHYSPVGGTGGDPLLSGTASNEPVSTSAVSAWVEAFASQTAYNEASWAADELTRISFNAIRFLLHQEQIPVRQYINSGTFSEAEDATDEQERIHASARLARAVSCIYKSAVALTVDNALSFNLLLHGRYLVSAAGQPVLFRIDENRDISIISGKSAELSVKLFYANTETCGFSICLNGQENEIYPFHEENDHGYYVILSHSHKKDGCLKRLDTKHIRKFDSHHQGKCYAADNRILACPVLRSDEWRIAVTGDPDRQDHEIVVPVSNVSGHWNCRNHLPADIPVLPEISGESRSVTLQPYDSLQNRMTVFPKAKEK